MIIDVLNVLKSVTPFNSLTLDVLNDLIPKLQEKTYPAGTYVFRQGEPSQQCLFIISQGSAEVVISNEKGLETVVGFRQRLDFFGETVVLTDQSYPASVRAKGSLSCYLLSRKDLERLISSHSDFAGFFSQILSERMRVLYEEIVTEQFFEAYSSVDTPLFSKRISEIMSIPVITCHPDHSVKSAIDIMMAKNISSLVVADDDAKPLGMVTEKGLVKNMVSGRLTSIENLTAGEIMDRQIITISPGAFFNQALLAVIKHQVKHLIVVDRGKLVGIVTLMDLIKARNTGTLLLTDEIDNKNSIDELAVVGKQVDNVLNALVAEKATVLEILEIMTELHDRLTRRVIFICEEEMARQGRGRPPVDYAWMHMGSAGRREQTLRTDQDNAIVYADPTKDLAAETATYFHDLAVLIVDGLEKCGFAKCQGGVMASNPQWCRSLSGWLEVVDEWMKKAVPENVRSLTIFLDFRYIYGENRLVNQLHEIILQQEHNNDSSAIISHLLTQDDIKFKVPLTLLGGFSTHKSGPHKGEVNLKNSAAIHIVNCIRVFAVKHGITEASTFYRIKVLNERKILPSDDAELIAAAYETLLMFRNRENLKKVKQGREPDNYINPHRLSKREQALLKDAFTAIARLQKLTSNRFSIYWLSYLSQ
ncbi:MAG: DUF294 nucleotidyltransferase-like domain-containing protein [Firmicutes bacterium]|nr:DUF294 nucleotidyltransferase-like domain-containing protein [Bacillota bacterium]